VNWLSGFIAGLLPPYDGHSPLLDCGIIRKFAFGKFRVTSRDDQLEPAFAKSKSTRTTHIEFSLHKTNALLVSLIERKDRMRKTGWGLALG
jgi:hypothetical protein